MELRGLTVVHYLLLLADLRCQVELLLLIVHCWQEERRLVVEFKQLMEPLGLLTLLWQPLEVRRVEQEQAVVQVAVWLEVEVHLHQQIKQKNSQRKHLQLIL